MPTFISVNFPLIHMPLIHLFLIKLIQPGHKVTMIIKTPEIIAKFCFITESLHFLESSHDAHVRVLFKVFFYNKLPYYYWLQPHVITGLLQ